MTKKQKINDILNSLKVDLGGVPLSSQAKAVLGSFSLFKTAEDSSQGASAAIVALTRAKSVILGYKQSDDQARRTQAIADMDDLIKTVKEGDYETAVNTIESMTSEDYLTGRYFSGDFDSSEVDLDGSVLDGTWHSTDLGPLTKKWVGYMQGAKKALENVSALNPDDVKAKYKAVGEGYLRWARTKSKEVRNAAQKELQNDERWSDYGSIYKQIDTVNDLAKIERLTARGQEALSSIQAKFKD